MKTDINGLRPCPACGVLGQVKLQTPPDDDDVVRRAYFRCFECGLVTPPTPDWEPVPFGEHGSQPFPPLRDYWNDWVAEYRPDA